MLRADDALVRVGEDALRAAQRASSDRAMGLSGYTLAVALLSRDTAADRDRGLELMMQTRAIWLRKRAHFLIPVTDVWAAREASRRGDLDAAISAMRPACDELRRQGNVFYGGWGTGVLVETLLERGAAADLVEASEAIDGLVNLNPDSALGEIRLLKLRTLLARATGDELTYRDRCDRYRAMARSLGFEGHLAWAEAMP